MIVWLASYPRSGNTFARFVIQQIYGAPLPNIYQRRPPAPDSPGGVRPPMFPELASGISLSEARSAAETMFVKTHELPADDAPAIYLVRDGRDALVSHAHFVLDIDLSRTSQAQEEFLRILEQLIETDNSFGGWGNNVLAWKKRQAPTAIVRFEDLIASPAATMRLAVEKLGIPVGERQSYEIPKFSELHTRQPKMFRRGEVGGWRTELPQQLHERFWQRYGAAMRSMGYERDGTPSAERTTSAA